MKDLPDGYDKFTTQEWADFWETHDLGDYYEGVDNKNFKKVELDFSKLKKTNDFKAERGQVMSDTTDSEKELEDIFRRLAERIKYNQHDMGEIGTFIRVKYAKNFLKIILYEVQELIKSHDHYLISRFEEAIPKLREVIRDPQIGIPVGEGSYINEGFNEAIRLLKEGVEGIKGKI